MSTNQRLRKQRRVAARCFESGREGRAGRAAQPNQHVGYSGGFAERARLRGQEQGFRDRLGDKLREERRTLNNYRIKQGQHR